MKTKPTSIHNQTVSESYYLRKQATSIHPAPISMIRQARIDEGRRLENDAFEKIAKYHKAMEDKDSESANFWNTRAKEATIICARYCA